MKYFKLVNDVVIPQIGFGTYKSTGDDDSSVIEMALEAGYTLFDTASFYQNEHIIAQAVERTETDRETLFLQTKIWKEDMGYDRTMASFEKSLNALNTDYLDLLLIHWPASAEEPDWKERNAGTWKAMEKIYREKSVRAIGVCNFLPHHLYHLMQETDIRPMVNQIEFHPGYLQKATVDFCMDHEILVQAWSPIGRARILEEKLLQNLAAKYNKSAAQICIRFALQCNVLPLPKSANAVRMEQNLDVFDFELEADDMSRLLTLPQLGWSGEHPDRPRVQI